MTFCNPRRPYFDFMLVGPSKSALGLGLLLSKWMGESDETVAEAMQEFPNEP